MNLIITREEKRDDGIFGILQGLSQTLLTLEHAYFDTETSLYQPKIPSGNYKCIRGIHHLPKREIDTTFKLIPVETFEILVPNHTGIVFHQGNFNVDSSGCVLLGMYMNYNAKEERSLILSKKAFELFMLELKDLNEFDLTIKS